MRCASAWVSLEVFGGIDENEGVRGRVPLVLTRAVGRSRPGHQGPRNSSTPPAFQRLGIVVEQQYLCRIIGESSPSRGLRRGS